MLKTCSKCGDQHPLSFFFKSGKTQSGKDKHRGDCKKCSKRDTSEWRNKNREHYNKYMGRWRTLNPDKIREVDIKRLYGLSLAGYQELIRSQNGVCKICGRGPGGIRPLAIDHDHKTKRIRGLLCYRCNQAIAILDRPEHLKQALAYLNQTML